MSIYTKTGDKGETSLFGGRRVSKANLQIAAYGDIDELTSIMGLIISLDTNKSRRQFLTGIQKDLYQIMAVLSNAKVDMASLFSKIKEFEQKIDFIENQLPKLTRFILPGGTKISSITHIARAVCRRAERSVIAFYEMVDVSTQLKDYKPLILQYLNRLSDLLFVLAREYTGKKEVFT